MFINMLKASKCECVLDFDYFTPTMYINGIADKLLHITAGINILRLTYFYTVLSMFFQLLITLCELHMMTYNPVAGSLIV